MNEHSHTSAYTHTQAYTHRHTQTQKCTLFTTHCNLYLFRCWWYHHHITLPLSFSLSRKQNWMLCLTEHFFVTLTQPYRRPYSYCVAFQKHIGFPIVADWFGLIMDACVRKETPHPCNHKEKTGGAAVIFCHSLSSLMRSLNQDKVRKLKEERQEIEVSFMLDATMELVLHVSFPQRTTVVLIEQWFSKLKTSIRQAWEKVLPPTPKFTCLCNSKFKCSGIKNGHKNSSHNT